MVVVVSRLGLVSECRISRAGDGWLVGVCLSESESESGQHLVIDLVSVVALVSVDGRLSRWGVGSVLCVRVATAVRWLSGCVGVSTRLVGAGSELGRSRGLGPGRV